VDLENGFCQINANGRRLHGGHSCGLGGKPS
jgi:hypothetical protein